MTKLKEMQEFGLKNWQEINIFQDFMPHIIGGQQN